MTDFNDRARKAEPDEPSLAGYLDFSFREGQRDNPDRYAGQLFNRRPQTVFNRGTNAEWTADCLVYSAHFDLGKAAPSEEAHKEAVLKFFKDLGVSVLKASVAEVEDAEDIGSRIRA